MTKAEKISGLSISKLTQIGIYKIWFINDLKNRVYIGSALRNGKGKYEKGFLSRWNLHLSNLINNDNCTPKLQHAFNKYGIENIRFEIIDILKLGYHYRYYEIIETGYISKYNAVKNGWNINKNGKNCIGTPMREEVKKKISILNSGKNNGMYGKFGKLNAMSKTVYQYDLDGNFIKEWESAREIERILGISYKQISQSFKTNSKFCKGYIWHLINMGNKIDKYIKYDPLQNLKKTNKVTINKFN
jgi:hypothetical protein